MSATCGLDFERQLASPGFEVRRVLSEGLRELGFQIVVDQMTRIEARRGSMIGYSLMLKAKLPLLAVIDISLESSGCAVVVHLSDAVKNVGKAWGMNRQFHELFEEVWQRLDDGLGSLDPASAGQFEPARFWSRSGDIGILEQGTALTSKAIGGAVGVAGKALDRPKSTTPGIWKGVDSVTFVSSAGEATLSLPEAQALLGIAVMIASHPGSMPPNLLRDVEAFAAVVEQRLTAAGGHAASVDVSDAYRPVFEFLNQQAQIRASLPMRQLYICRSCRLEKIVNPEYKRITARNEKIGDIMAGVGATITKGGISPTFVLGQVFKLKKLDPEYVCGRCQGMEADERVVTFCPKCADMQRDVVLRLCAKCKFDFRTKAAPGPVWTVPAPPTEDPEAILGEAGAAEMPAAEAVAASMGVSVRAPSGDDFEAEFAEEVAAIAPEASGEEPGPTPELPAVEPPASEPDHLAPEPAPAGTLVPVPGPAPVPVPAPAPAAPPTAYVPTPWPQPRPAAPPQRPVATQPWAAAPQPRPGPHPPAPAPEASPAPSAWTHPLSVPFGSPEIGPGGGKVCHACRREHPSLWRVVVATPYGYEERFLCGSTVACQMPSLVVARLV